MTEDDTGLEPRTQNRGPKRTRWMVLTFGLVAAVAAWWIFGSVKPEFVSNVIPGMGAHAANGRLNWVEQRDGLFTVWSLDPTDGQPKVVFRRAFKGQIYGDRGFAGDYLYVVEGPRWSPRTNSIQGGAAYGGTGPASTPSRFLGSFCAAKQRKPNETVRIQAEQTYWAEGRSVLYRISLVSGTLETVNVNTGGTPLQSIGRMIEGENLFWVKPGIRKYTYVSNGKENWFEYPSDRRLMMSPLSGGPPVELAAGLTSNDRLIVGKGLIGWLAIRATPDTRRDLKYVRLRDGKRGSLPVSIVYEDVTVFDGKFYWLEGGAVLSLHQNARLMEVDPDTGRSKVIHDNSKSDHHIGSMLTAYDGRLYAGALWGTDSVKLQPNGYFGPSGVGSRQLLVRLDPSGEKLITGIRELPVFNTASVYLLDDHVYYGVSEPRQSLFDFAYTSSTVKMGYALYRLTLP